MASDTDEAISLQLYCPRCERAMRPDTVRTAIWRDDRLVVVEDIPAQVCDACMEQFYDDDTTEALRRLMEEDFPRAEATRELLVPIFSLRARLSDTTKPDK
jgi:YgiT-type zinc finger domain-containing protein